MKTPVKRSQAAPTIHVYDVGQYVNEPVPDEDGSKVTAKKSNHDERRNYNKGLIVQKN